MFQGKNISIKEKEKFQIVEKVQTTMEKTQLIFRPKRRLSTKKIIEEPNPQQTIDLSEYIPGKGTGEEKYIQMEDKYLQLTKLQDKLAKANIRISYFQKLGAKAHSRKIKLGKGKTSD